MRRRLAGTVAAILALVPLCATASDQDDALKIAQRAASMNDFRAVTVRLHALPASFPASLPLPKATLLGSVEPNRPPRSGPSGRSATIVMTASYPAALYYEAPNRDVTVKAYEETLRAAGWKHVNLSERFPFPRGGFAQEFPQFDAWCSPATPPGAITIMTPKYDSTALDLTVTLDAPPGGMVCGGDNSGLLGFTEAHRKPSPLPTFTAASGIAIDNAGPASDGSTTGARITSSLGIAAVFESFAKQLRDAGWAPKGNAASSGVRSQTFAKTVDGMPYLALLAIYPLDATHYVALADVSNVKE
jgi:hypothetical protein